MKITTSQGVVDVADVEISAEVAALKSGLGPFYGRLLAALERIADAQEATRKRVESLQPLPARKKADDA